MTVDTKWFKERLADRKLSQRGLAKLMELDPAAISLLLRGMREMKMTEAVTIAGLIGVPPEEVMERAGVRVSPKSMTIPIGAWMDARAEVHIENPATKSVPHPGGDLPESSTACQCRTAGSDLDHMDGWVMFAARMHYNQGISADAVGRLAFVKIKHSGIYVAKIARSTRRGYWTLHVPTGVMPDVELEWAQPILLVAP